MFWGRTIFMLEGGWLLKLYVCTIRCSISENRLEQHLLKMWTDVPYGWHPMKHWKFVDGLKGGVFFPVRRYPFWNSSASNSTVCRISMSRGRTCFHLGVHFLLEVTCLFLSMMQSFYPIGRGRYYNWLIYNIIYIHMYTLHWMAFQK